MHTVRILNCQECRCRVSKTQGGSERLSAQWWLVKAAAHWISHDSAIRPGQRDIATALSENLVILNFFFSRERA